LNKVARLEEFPARRIERVADRRVVQYRGQILPLLDVECVLRSGHDRNGLLPPGGGEGESLPSKDAVHVVVCARQERPVGLVVERILDIVEQDTDVRGPSSRCGVECTAVVQGHVTEMLDVEALIQAVSGGGEI